MNTTELSFEYNDDNEDANKSEELHNNDNDESSERVVPPELPVH
jgi:hypothetical protein